MVEVRRFFDRHAAGYAARDAGMRPFHRRTAGRLAAVLSGDVLSVGGLWAQARVPDAVRLVVVDLSAPMLRLVAAPALLARADARALPFADQSFDHVVLPLVLHHVAGRSVDQAQRHARVVLLEAHRVLRPGGRLWISEFCVGRLVYAAQRLLAPVMRRLLGAAGVPLVVMHDASFYKSALSTGDWADVEVQRIVAPDAGLLDTITPVIGLPFLKVPRVLYPLTPTLVTARRDR